MKKIRVKNNRIYILLSALMVIAIIGVCYYGEKSHENQTKKVEGILNDSKVQAAKLQENKKEEEDKPKYTGPLKYNDKSIPVLMYHSLEYLQSEPKNDLRIPKEKFREQMKYLKDNGYTTLTMQELYEFFKDNKPVPEKSVVLTFDDGYEDNYTNGLPVIKEFGLKATVFVVTDWIGTNNAYMTLDQLKEMDANGFDVQSHTLAHKELAKLSYEEQLKTLKESKEYLEKNLNKKITTICYPYGSFNDNTIKAAQEAGYSMGIKMVGGIANKNNGMFKVNRIYVKAQDTIEQFASKLKSN